MIGENQVIGDDSSSELKSNYILMGHFSESEDCTGGIHKHFVIYRGKVREKFPAIYLVVKFPKIKSLFCQLTISLINAI